MKFAPMAILAMALLHAADDARWDIVIEPAALRRAAIEARGHSELGPFGTGSAIGPGRKNPPACLCVSDRHFYPSTLTDFDETWLQGPYSCLLYTSPSPRDS